MASNIFTTDGDGAWLVVNQSPVHVGLQGTFGGGTVAVQREVNGVAGPLLDVGVAVEYTSDFDDSLNLQKGDRIRLVLTGATSPSINWQVSGASISR